METTRRSFLAGLAITITAAALPAIPFEATAAPRLLPKIALRVPSQGYFTADYLRRCIDDLYSQVAEMAPLNPTAAERNQIIENIDAELDNVRPVGLQILVKTSPQNMLRGAFTIREDQPGTVLIT